MKRSVYAIVLLAAICLATVHFIITPGDGETPPPQSSASGAALAAANPSTPPSPAPPVAPPSTETGSLTPEAAATPRQISGILLVNADNPLPDNYRPERLVDLYAQKHKHFQLMSADIKICETVYTAMEQMFAAAQADGVRGFVITSGHRTYSKQTEIYQSAMDGAAAPPGCSEHETGLAFDVGSVNSGNFASTAQFDWLSEHCAEYGFILRYPFGKERVTGIPYEPWHYRYVGIEAAMEIMESGMTLEEYLGADSVGFEESAVRGADSRPGRKLP